jgi:hypothetical protein
MAVRRFWSFIVVAILALSLTGQAVAQVVVNRRFGGGGPGTTSLPMYVSDQLGNRWIIQRGGWLQSQSNNTPPTYSQAAMVMINQTQPNQMNNSARVVDKTGEIIIEGLSAPQAGITVTRRVLVNKEEGYVRYIDIFTNNQGGDQTLNIQVQSNFSYGIQQAQTIADKKSKQNVAVVTQDPNMKVAA